MDIRPLAADSMGARSMAFLVETGDVKLVIDPGVRLGPLRYGLEPHRLELERLSELRERIIGAVRKADVVTVSHYHYDHHEDELADIYEGRDLLVKHPEDDINKSQRGRAKAFLNKLGDGPRSLEFADGRTFRYGGTDLAFSEAVAHGPSKRLGYVVQLAITSGDQTFLHTSDIQGPCLKEHLAFILEASPGTMVCDGPLTYMMYRYGKKALARTIKNLVKVIRDTDTRTLMLEHHLLREKNWKEKMGKVFEAGEEHGCQVMTAAEFAGEEVRLLEARRKELHGEGEPPKGKD